MTTTFYDETAFFDSWKIGVTIAGPRYFEDGTYSPTTARGKWDLEPRLDRSEGSFSVGVYDSLRTVPSRTAMQITT